MQDLVHEIFSTYLGQDEILSNSISASMSIRSLSIDHTRKESVVTSLLQEIEQLHQIISGSGAMPNASALIIKQQVQAAIQSFKLLNQIQPSIISVAPNPFSLVRAPDGKSGHCSEMSCRKKTRMLNLSNQEPMCSVACAIKFDANFEEQTKMREERKKHGRRKSVPA